MPIVTNLADHLMLMPFESLLVLAMIAVTGLAAFVVYAALTIAKSREHR